MAKNTKKPNKDQTKNAKQANTAKSSKTAQTAREKKTSKRQKEPFDWKAWLISLLITLVLVGGVLGFQYWLTSQFENTVDQGAFWTGNLLGDAVGGFIMLFIVHHFVKKPKNDPYGQQ